VWGSRRLFLFALAAFTLVPAPAIAQLSPAETRMIQTVDAEQDRTLQMLEKWINQNSGSLNIPGVTKVGEMLRAELEPLGFAVQWIDMKAPAGPGTSFATHKGNG
jgi:glutamate carboxypeptidase